MNNELKAEKGQLNVAKVVAGGARLTGTRPPPAHITLGCGTPSIQSRLS